MTGRQFRTLREKHRLRIDEVAIAAGCHPNTIAHFEGGSARISQRLLGLALRVIRGEVVVPRRTVERRLREYRRQRSDKARRYWTKRGRQSQRRYWKQYAARPDVKKKRLAWNRRRAKAMVFLAIVEGRRPPTPRAGRSQS